MTFFVPTAAEIAKLTDQMRGPLAQRAVSLFDSSAIADPASGRRMRVFGMLVRPHGLHNAIQARSPWQSEPFLPPRDVPLTYGELYELIHTATVSPMADMNDAFGSMILRDEGMLSRDSHGGTSRQIDPTLHAALQDLGDEINEDVREACFAFDDPDLWYPGIDEGIEPVTDEHVSAVTVALQRELNRELRSKGVVDGRMILLPAVPLAELPWRIQRALAERRRMRYLEYGITRERWAANRWSVWDVPEDPEFVPRRAARLSMLQQ